MKAPKAKINSERSINKCYEMAANALVEWDGLEKEWNVSISANNSKLGEVANISLPPVATCTNCMGCKNICYAVRSFLRMGYITKEGKYNSWLKNYVILKNDPDRYFEEISKQLFIYRFFRWHVSGDILNMDYLKGMVKVAVESPHCRMLAFTKNYSVVNQFMDTYGYIPENLIIMFSAAENTKMVNPYNFPECHIAFEDSTKDTYKGNASGNVYHCTGNCEECIARGCGCFNMKKGDVTIINQH